MKISSKFALAMLPMLLEQQVLYGQGGADNEKNLNRYDELIETSTYNMSKCIEIVNKFEILIAEIGLLLKSINSDVTTVSGNENLQPTKEILKNISTICKLLQETINEKTSKEEEQAVKLSESMQSDETNFIGRYEAITKILVSFHEKIYKLIIKFNMLQKALEDVTTEIAHDLRNINSTMNSKEASAKKADEGLTELKSEAKKILTSLEKGIDECKKHLDIIEKVKKAPTSEVKTNGKKSSDTDSSGKNTTGGETVEIYKKKSRNKQQNKDSNKHNDKDDASGQKEEEK